MCNDVNNYLEEIRVQSQDVWESGFGGDFTLFQGDLEALKQYYSINYPVNGRNFEKLDENELPDAINKIIKLSLGKDSVAITSNLLDLISNESNYLESYRARSYEDQYNNDLHIAFVSKNTVYELVLYWAPD